MAAARQSPTAYCIQIPATAVSSDSPATCSWLSRSMASDGRRRVLMYGCQGVKKFVLRRELSHRLKRMTRIRTDKQRKLRLAILFDPAIRVNLWLIGFDELAYVFVNQCGLLMNDP